MSSETYEDRLHARIKGQDVRIAELEGTIGLERIATHKLEQQLAEAQADTRKHLDTVINQNSELLVLRAQLAEVRDKVEGMLERGAEIRELRKQLAALRLQTTECNGFDCCPLAPELAKLREVYRYAKGLCMGEDWNKGTAALYYRKPLREAVEKATLQEGKE